MRRLASRPSSWQRRRCIPEAVDARREDPSGHPPRAKVDLCFERCRACQRLCARHVGDRDAVDLVARRLQFDVAASGNLEFDDFARTRDADEELEALGDVGCFVAEFAKVDAVEETTEEIGDGPEVDVELAHVRLHMGGVSGRVR